MSVGSDDLTRALVSIGLFLLALAAITAAVVWLAHRRGSTTVALDSALVVASVWTALGVVATIFSLAQTLGGGSIYIAGLPVSTTWPTPLPCHDPGAALPPGAYIECATMSQANAWISGLPIAPRIVIAVGQLASAALAILPGALVAVVCFQTLRGRPFASVVTRALLTSAGVVVVAGLTYDIFTGVGRGLAAQAVLPTGVDAPLVSGAPFQISVQLWPIGAALALAALAVVFRYGGRLQRDTEGLV